jgi:hypothetical protein
MITHVMTRQRSSFGEKVPTVQKMIIIINLSLTKVRWRMDTTGALIRDETMKNNSQPDEYDLEPRFGI